MDLLKMIAIGGSVTVLFLVVELIRRGKLKERYSLLWLLASVVLLALSSTQGILFLSHVLGIYYPPSALFLVAFLFLLLITLHFSVVISELSEKNKRLAQEIALLRRDMDDRLGASTAARAADGASRERATE